MRQSLSIYTSQPDLKFEIITFAFVLKKEDLFGAMKSSVTSKIHRVQAYQTLEKFWNCRYLGFVLYFHTAKASEDPESFEKAEKPKFWYLSSIGEVTECTKHKVLVIYLFLKPAERPRDFMRSTF